MIRRVLHYGEDALRHESEPVKDINDEIRDLVRDMFETMYKNSGVGLAAPQIGLNICLFVIDTGNNQQLTFINPKIIKGSGKETMEEGCLSFPGMREKVTRAQRVTARATDLDGREYEVQTEGLLARAIQHEYDHLEGVLLIDRISKARRIQLKHDFERLAAGESLVDDTEEEKE